VHDPKGSITEAHPHRHDLVGCLDWFEAKTRVAGILKEQTVGSTSPLLDRP